jgi:deoxyribonuclease-4
MLLGAHVSVAGGLHQAPHNGKRLGCSAIQIFTRNQRQWSAKKLTPAEVEGFQMAVQSCALESVVSHDSYLINLASPDERILQRSQEAFRDELDRCNLLGISCLIFHPGSHLGTGEKEGLSQVAESLNWIMEQRGRSETRLLIETTAGQGTNLGYKFEHLAEILCQVEASSRMGICLDTCHLFAAGYDLRTARAYDKTMKQFDDIVGLTRVKAIHLNDAMNDLGSRVDRHESIGRGRMGIAPFRLLLNEERFRSIPMLLETPGGEDGYRRDLATLRRLLKPELLKRTMKKRGKRIDRRND